MQRTILFCVAILMLATGNAYAENPVSVLMTMNKMMDRLAAGDVQGAKQHALSYEEFAAVSKRKIAKKDYQGNLEGFLKMISGELKAGVKLQRIGHIDALILPAGEKTRHEVVMAVVHATFRLKGKQKESDPVTFLFISHGGKWKFFLRK